MKRSPFVVAYKFILNHPKLSLQSKALFLILKQHANKDGMNCFPKMSTLAKEGNCSESTVKRCLEELKENDLIEAIQLTTIKGKKAACSYLLYDDPKASLQKPKIDPKRMVPPWVAHDLRSSPPVTYGDEAKIVPFTEENKVEEKPLSRCSLIAKADEA